MSYDLMVFEPAAAPAAHESFIAWYRKQMKWAEGHSYADPSVASARLRAWLLDISVRFPSRNDDLSALPEDDGALSAYSIGKPFIYASFAWSRAEDAYGTVFDLAGKHALGFFHVSSNGREAWLPSNDGLALANEAGKPAMMARIKKLLAAK
jgi:hypothetical protein